jgi:adenine phosphoribosyltransferase
MYINDVEAGDNVLVLDDVLSTGGTLTAICDALEDIGANLIDVVAVIKKVGGENRLSASPHSAKTLINVDVVDGEVVVVDPTGDH